MNFDQARFNMIEQQIRPWDVLDPAVLRVLSTVKREDFVAAAQRNLAFTDVELPLGGGQVMLAPRVEARILQDLQLHPTDKVLEVGAGSGFMAALLAHMAGKVISLEIDPELAALATSHLRRAGLSQVTVRQADGSQGLAAEGPFDAIVLSGSVAQVPQALLDQLRVGGRLITVVGEEPVMKAVRITRVTDKDFRTERLFDTVAPRLKGFEAEKVFAF